MGFMKDLGGALIGGVGTLGGSIIQSRAAGKAAQSQERSTAAALQWEREKEMRRRQEYDQAQQMSRAQWDAYNANRAALLARYGFSMPSTPQFSQPQAQAQPQNIAGLMGGGQPQPGPQSAGPSQPQYVRAQMRNNIAGLLDPRMN